MKCPAKKASRRALQEFLDGLADWEATEPGVKKQMIITFGLFSTPTISLNKQPNVDFHVWMDQQMNVAANDPSLAHIAGLNWWTYSSLTQKKPSVSSAGSPPSLCHRRKNEHADKRSALSQPHPERGFRARS